MVPALVLPRVKRGDRLQVSRLSESAAFVEELVVDSLLSESFLGYVGDLELLGSWRSFRFATFLLYHRSGSIACSGLERMPSCCWTGPGGVCDNNAVEKMLAKKPQSTQ